MGLVAEVAPFFEIIGAFFNVLPLPIQMLIISCFAIPVLLGVLLLVHK